MKEVVRIRNRPHAAQRDSISPTFPVRQVYQGLTEIIVICQACVKISRSATTIWRYRRLIPATAVQEGFSNEAGHFVQETINYSGILGISAFASRICQQSLRAPRIALHSICQLRLQPPCSPRSFLLCWLLPAPRWPCPLLASLRVRLEPCFILTRCSRVPWKARRCRRSIS